MNYKEHAINEQPISNLLGPESFQYLVNEAKIFQEESENNFSEFTAEELPLDFNEYYDIHFQKKVKQAINNLLVNFKPNSVLEEMLLYGMFISAISTASEVDDKQVVDELRELSECVFSDMDFLFLYDGRYLSVASSAVIHKMMGFVNLDFHSWHKPFK